MEHVAQVVDPFVFRLSIFVLAVFVGYFVVWSVTPALHTPLMSVTNAISSVIVVGALLAVGVAQIGSGAAWPRGFGFLALVFACVRIFWGFLVTPRMVGAFAALGGMAAVLVAAGVFYAPEAFDIGTPGHIHPQSLVEMSLGVAIGALTFTGSVIAFLKLSARMSGAPIILPARHIINIVLGIALVVFIVGLVISGSAIDFWLITIIALALRVRIIIPLRGADMPVVISMLNSYSGWAAAGIGCTLGNSALIITGALVGSSGAILSYIMCKGMNRSFISVILGGFGGETAAAAGAAEQKPVKLGSAEDAAYVMKNASKVIIVPGYRMAGAHTQHPLRGTAPPLTNEGVHA